MNKRKVCEEIVNQIYGREFIPVSFSGKASCFVRNGLYINGDGVIKKVVPKKVVLSKDFVGYNFLVDFLSDDYKMVVKKYNPVLISILHEIGHVNTLVGLNNNEIKEEVAGLREFCNDFASLNIAYRQTRAERRADVWMVDWIIDNRDKAKIYSEILDEVFGK